VYISLNVIWEREIYVKGKEKKWKKLKENGRKRKDIEKI
jgi:hypothetical protein